jgi:hypothetical protein
LNLVRQFADLNIIKCMELHDLYALPNIVGMIVSKRMRWAGHVACMGAVRNAYRIVVGRP